MPTLDADSIRQIFLGPHRDVSTKTAAFLLGVLPSEVEAQIADGEIVPISTSRGIRIPRPELIGAALRSADQEAIEVALGADGERLLPKYVRLVELRARIPRYQREMLSFLASKYNVTVNSFLAAQFRDLESSHSEELEIVLPTFRAALNWPDLN